MTAIAHAEANDIRRRRRIVVVPARMLSLFLSGELAVEVGIPEGATVNACAWSVAREAFMLAVVHWTFDPIDDGVVAPEHVVVFVQSKARRGISLGDGFSVAGAMQG